MSHVKGRSFYFPLLLATLLLGGSVTALPSNGTPLKSINYSGASVLPFIDSEDVVVLSRESGGSHRGTWDAFGGGRDDHESDPAMTAAREFYEEAIVEKTLGWDLATTKDYVSLHHPHTHLVIAKQIKRNTFAPLFLTTLTKKDISALVNNFAHARKHAHAWKYREKDGIALVLWDDLKAAIAQSRSSHNVTVPAHVTYPKDHHTEILLRPYLVGNLRPYIKGHSYNSGHDVRVRYYR